MNRPTIRRPRATSAQSGPVVLILISVGLALVAALGVDGRQSFSPLPVHAQSSGYSLRLYGNGVAAPGLDRVIIPIDAPARPADLGATDFTIEFWVKALASENPGTVQCNTNAGWITGNTVIDRDIFGDGDFGDYGIALGGGRIAFGVSVGTAGTTLCGSTVVADGRWHHVAAVRRLTGTLQLFVDGVPDGSAQGPGGNASYRDGRSSIYPFDPTLVLGAEKHDAGAEYPSFSGWLDELRLSTNARYSAAFISPTAPFVTDGATAALYHFDEGPAGACQGTILDVSGAGGGPSNGACAYGGAPQAGPVYATDQPFAPAAPTATNTNTALPPTNTSTPAAPTATNTALPPTNTSTPAAPTATNTALPPTNTNTPVPPTATNTNTALPPTNASTPVPPTATVTNTVLPPTNTSTPAPTTATNTPAAQATISVTPATLAPTATPTPAPLDLTATAIHTSTVTETPAGTIPPAPSSTPVGAATPDSNTPLPLCPTAAPIGTPPAVPSTVGNGEAKEGPTLYLPAIQFQPPCVTTTLPD